MAKLVKLKNGAYVDVSSIQYISPPCHDAHDKEYDVFYYISGKCHVISFNTTAEANKFIDSLTKLIKTIDMQDKIVIE